MNLENIFEDSNSIKIWKNYFKRVDKIIAVLDKNSQNETKMELHDHLYNSYLEQEGKEEVGKLLTAIERLGEPDDFLKPIVSEKLLREGSKTLSPKTLFKGLLYNVSGSIKNLFTTLFFSFGYLVTFIFGLMSFLKFVIPEKVGLFIWPDGSWNFGIVKSTKGAEELFGFWIVPIGLLVAFFLYYLLTQILKLTFKKK